MFFVKPRGLSLISAHFRLPWRHFRFNDVTSSLWWRHFRLPLSHVGRAGLEPNPNSVPDLKIPFYAARSRGPNTAFWLVQIWNTAIWLVRSQTIPLCFCHINSFFTSIRFLTNLSSCAKTLLTTDLLGWNLWYAVRICGFDIFKMTWRFLEFLSSSPLKACDQEVSRNVF